MSDIEKIINDLPKEALTPAAAEALGRETTPIEEKGMTEAPPIENNENTPIPPSNVTPESESQSETKEPTIGGRRTFKRKGGKRKQQRRKTHKKKRRSHKRR